MKVGFSSRTTATSHFSEALFSYLIKPTSDIIILFCYLESKQDQRPLNSSVFSAATSIKWVLDQIFHIKTDLEYILQSHGINDHLKLSKQTQSEIINYTYYSQKPLILRNKTTQ